MKNKKIIVRFKRQLSALFLLGSLLGCTMISAQTATYPAKSNYEDYVIPSSSTGYIKLTAKGGGGGVARFKNAFEDFKVSAGKGATVFAYFKIGTEDYNLKPGSTLRFIVGSKGYDKTSDVNFGTGGGGGTGIAYRDGDSGEWTLLMVAGGGGGAGWDLTNGRITGSGSSYIPGEEGNGNGGASVGINTAYAGGGGGAFGGDEAQSRDTSNPGDFADWEYGVHAEAGWSDGPDSGAPTGGACNGEYYKGGWGFGAGGNGDPLATYAGGGGGYTGGNYRLVDKGYSMAGTSYINLLYGTKFSADEAASSSTTTDGYASYESLSTSEYEAIPVVKKVIRFAASTGKCMDIKDGATSNGTNIQILSCDGLEAQNWILNDGSLQMYTHSDKCVDLTSSSTSNGTNIQLWECNGTNAQKWIYDVNNNFIRSSVNGNKCVALTNGITTNGNNIQLYDCKYNQYKPNQQWVMDGITSSMQEGDQLRMHFAKDPSKCLDFKNAATTDGTNVMLYNCHYTDSQYLKFDGEQIKMWSSGKCVDVKSGSTSNGANVQLYTCNNSDAQQWIYDGFTQTFRFKKNLSKCLDVKSGNTANGTNIQLWDCNGSDAQQWRFYK